MKKLGLIALFAIVVGLFAVSVAGAAQWNSVHGNATTTWYAELYVRTITTPNDTIQLQLDTLPSGHLYWALFNADSSGGQIGTTKTIPDTKAYTLGTGVPKQKFINRWRTVTGSGPFDGREYY